MLNYQLIRSRRRKTLQIQIKQGQVLVRAPVYMPLLSIERFLLQKSAWLQQKITEQAQNRQIPPLVFAEGVPIYYLGEVKTIAIKYAMNKAVKVCNEQLEITLSYRQQKKLTTSEQLHQAIKTYLASFFKRQLEYYLSTRLPVLSEQIGLYPTANKVRFYKSRWGSCNNRGELQFNYLLMMLPTWVIDYVIIHELCHLQYLNHSKEFWSLVHRHCINTDNAKKWLKQHQHILSWPA